jgi:hypothetical protein
MRRGSRRSYRRGKIWVRATTAATVTLDVDLLDRNRRYLRSVSSASVRLTANAWTRLSVTFTAKTSQVYAAMAPSFSGATRGTTSFAWDDMSVTAG